MDSSNPMAWVVKKAKLNSKKFFWDTLIMKLKCLAIGYSVCSLVWHWTEEQITGNFASQIFKQPSKHGWEGPRSCQKYSQLLYDQFGGWLEASNHPPLFARRRSASY